VQHKIPTTSPHLDPAIYAVPSPSVRLFFEENTMKMIQSYLRAHSLQLFVAVLICAGLAFGMIDPAAALVGGIMLDTAPVNMKELYEATQKAFEAMKGENNELKTRLLEVEQKLALKPGMTIGKSGGGGGIGEMADLILQSDQLKAYVKGSAASVQISIPSGIFRKAMIVSVPGVGQPLVPPDFRPGITHAPQRRLTIRDLFNSVQTTSNLIEFTREIVFTNNAGPQYSASPPLTEGALKNESALTFQLANSPVATVAHWVPASRQILADAPSLQQYLESRLLYGLKLKEETALLLGDGTVGNLNGMVHQATAFTGAGSGLTALDHLALAIGQLAASEYEPSGFILNPQNWYSSDILLKKNTLGDYIFGDPGEMTVANLWGLPVVVTNSMTPGKFVCLDAPRTGYIADREDATVRISESHADFFLRNAVAVLCEERLAFIVEQGAAMIYGSL
jgi:HK97 family phage major capsid protein